jgi:hypothetical protein
MVVKRRLLGKIEVSVFLTSQLHMRTAKSTSETGLRISWLFFFAPLQEFSRERQQIQEIHGERGKLANRDGPVQASVLRSAVKAS